MYCTHCGASIDNDAQMCLNCGTPVDSREKEVNPYFTGTQYGDKSLRHAKYGEPGIPCSFGQAVGRVLSTWTFKGRASRSEYWYWSLFYFLTTFVASFTFTFCQEIGILRGYLWVLYWAMIAWIWLAFLPNLFVTVRRLHDVGMSGLWFLVWPISVFLLRGGSAVLEDWGPIVAAVGTICLLAWFIVVLSMPPVEKQRARKKS